MENKTPNQKPIKPTVKKPKFNVSWNYGIIILVLLGSYFFNENIQPKEVPFSTFKEYVKLGMIDKVDVYTSKSIIEAKLINYASAAKDSITLNKIFGSKYLMFVNNDQLLKDSLAMKDTLALKKV